MSTAPEPNPSPPKIYGTAKPEEIKQNHIDGFSGDWRIILIVGEGGTGKTRRLRDLEKLLQSPDSNRIVAPLYDFYHIDNFKASSIEQTIIDVLRGHGADDTTFKAYNTARQALEAARDDTSVSFLDKQQEVRAAFIKDYNAFAAAQPQHIVLIFDTVEQSVPLTDEAEHELVQPQMDASAGGYYWLINMLPQLQRTITVLGGRSAVLYGKPVPLYDDLSNVVRLDVGELGAEDTEKFAIDQLTSLIKKTEQDLAHAKATGDVLAQETAKESLSILKDIVLQKDELYAISRGIPFWIDVFLTLNQLGIIPKTRLDELYDRVSNKSAPEQLSEQERNTYRQALIEELLGEMGPDSPPLLLALQCMASLRKGVNRKMLVHVAKPYAEKNVPAFDVDSIWDRLQNLLIVKQRELPAVMVDKGDEDTTLLFLHDEMYRWFDQHGRAQSEVDVTEAIIAWYDQQLETLEAQRKQQTLDVLEQAPTLDSRTNTEEQPSADYKAMKAQLTTIVRRQEQYRLDQLHYRYQANAGSKAGFSAADLVEPTHTYNLLAYEAILGRDIGTGATLRQETLQNSYRLQRADTLPPFIQAECAARWLLRITYNDVPATADPEATIKAARAFTEQLGDAPEDQLARALMDVAETRFWLERDFSGKEPKIRTLLETAETYAKKPAFKALVSNSSESKLSESELWQTFLQAEIRNVWGLLARRQYNLPVAIANYEVAYARARSTERLKPLQAQILNNLAFARSEQGFVDEAREYAQTALRIRLQFASDYDIALSRNTLARIEIRAGQPALAYRFAQQASATMKRIDSTRGTFMTLPVLAETQRKLAEQLSYAPTDQDHFFQQAIDTLTSIAETMQNQKSTSRERWREVYQNLGCTYRSKALARQNRLELFQGAAYAPDQDDTLTEIYRLAAIYLKRAYIVASGRQSSRHDNPTDAEQQQAFDFDELLPKAANDSQNAQHDVFLVDILEDLAVIFVNADVYDPRLEQMLNAAEQHAPNEYKITEGGRVRELKNHEAIRGYWRELGQIELQHTLANFGMYEYGFFKAPDDRTVLYGGNESNREKSPQQLEYLDAAVKHMIRMLAYLLHYDPEALLLKKARQLVLRELTKQKETGKNETGKLDIVAQLPYLRAKADHMLRLEFDFEREVQTAVENMFDLADQRAKLQVGTKPTD